MVGWPPVRSCRKNAMNERYKYVKVAVDGAPYLRKVNLQVHSNYQELIKDFHYLFTIREYILLTFDHYFNLYY